MARSRNRMGNINEVSAKWARNLAASGKSIQDGVMRMTVSPTSLAADQRDAYVNGVIGSADLWERKMRAVSLADWQNAMIQYGVPKIAIGVKKGEPKYAQHLTRWSNYFASVIDPALASQPRGNLQQNIQRAVTVMQLGSQYRQAQGQ